MKREQFAATPVYVVPILAGLLVSILCTLLIMESPVELATLPMLPETGYGPVLNAIVFVLAAGSGATIVYILLKKGVHRLLRLILGVAFSVITFSLVSIYSELAAAILILRVGLHIQPTVILIISSLATVFVVLEVILKKGRFYEVAVIGLGGAIGTLLGASIPLSSAVMILLLLAFYDVVAVFRGPVGKIASRGLEHLPGISFAFKEVHVGLGDLTFYSMLVSRVFLSFGWQACVAAASGVLLGSFFSFKMVEKKGMFPGLPFSVFCGLLASFVVVVWI